MKSIQSKILVSMISCVTVSLLLVGGIACVLGYNGTMETLQDSMTATAAIAADRVSYQLLEYKTIAQDAGCLPILTDPDATLAEKQAALQERVDTYGLQRYNLLDTSGKSYLDGNDYSSRTYFQQSIKGNAWVSEPLVSAVTGEVTIIVSAPVYRDGDTSSSIVGVVYFVPQETFLNDIVTSIRISDNGSAYMLDSIGNTIAHKNMESVKNVENTISDAKTDSSLSALATIESAMIAGNSGYDRYTYGGVTKMMAYAPVSDTNGWSIAVNAPVSDFTGAAIRSVLVTAVLLVLSIGAACILALRLAKGIGRPIKVCANRLHLLAQGDLDTPVEQFRSKDEVGELVSSTQIIVDSLRTIIGDIDYLLSQLGNGNFAADSQAAAAYTGNYSHILSSMRLIREKLSSTLSQISLSANQITLGSAQVSDGAQSLAQGATEQASSAEQLVAMVSEINNALIQANQAAIEASTKADDAGHVAGECNDHMKELVAAMNEISSTSERIGKIIKEIDDIAFQTNILALNAAVEAARAGAAGKGFAVVADEVRNLATKSAESAKNTSILVEDAMTAVSKGSHLVDATAARLQTVSDNSTEMAALVQNIAATAQQSTDSVQQINTGIEQISAVIQSTSATSEESAAASEELSSQAQLLNSLVSQFHLSNG